MKKLLYIALATAFVVSSCGKFGDTNTDPEHLNEGNVPIEMIFTNGLHQCLGSDWDAWRAKSIGMAQWVQQLASCRYWEGNARLNYREDVNSSFWDMFSGDRGAFFQITWCMNKWADMEGYEIDYNIARVAHAYVFMNLTDLFGDVPYTQACRPDQFSYPAYDTQESIYDDIFKELDDAQSKLSSGTAKMGNADIWYNGDAASWKKLANSLMLRAAMRLVKVDANKAKTYAAKALANGLIDSNDANAKLGHRGGVTTNDSAEPFAKIHSHEDREFHIAETFADLLIELKDPRAALIATRCNDKSVLREYPDIQNGATDAYYGNPDPALLRGFPTGFNNDDEDTHGWYVKLLPRHADFDNSILARQYSTVNRYTYSDPEAPTFICTYAQTQLLLAEAVVRGFINGNAKTYYENAIKASVGQYAQFPNSYVPTLINTYLSDAAISAYLAQPGVAWNESKALELINTQYYIISFGDEVEVFNNWRRSGYPELEVPLPIKGGTVGNLVVTADPLAMCTSIPRRLQYPTAEIGSNSTNYQAAVSRSGNLSNGDKWDSRVWWDK